VHPFDERLITYQFRGDLVDHHCLVQPQMVGPVRLCDKHLLGYH
jgi:hypothetical protein